jgi:hypothetical protein
MEARKAADSDGDGEGADQKRPVRFDLPGQTKARKASLRARGLADYPASSHVYAHG